MFIGHAHNKRPDSGLYFVLIGYTELQLSRWLSSEHVHSNKAVRQLMGLLQLRFEYDSSTIRARFEHDTTSYEELCAFKQ